jgi:hypothetical protein
MTLLSSAHNQYPVPVIQPSSTATLRRPPGQKAFIDQRQGCSFTHSCAALKKLFTPICADLDRRKASLVEWNVSRHQAAQAVDDGTVGYCRGRVEVAVHLRPCAREVKGSRASAPAAVTAAHRWPEPGAGLVGGVVG